MPAENPENPGLSVTNTPLFILLVSPEHERLQMAAMVASIGAASERSVSTLVSMNALPCFEKGLATDKV